MCILLCQKVQNNHKNYLKGAETHPVLTVFNGVLCNIHAFAVILLKIERTRSQRKLLEKESQLKENNVDWFRTICLMTKVSSKYIVA